MLEAVQPRRARQDKSDQKVPQGVDGHAQQAHGGFAQEVHVRLEHLSQDGHEKQGDFRIEKSDGKPFSEPLGS